MRCSVAQLDVFVFLCLAWLRVAFLCFALLSLAQSCFALRCLALPCFAWLGFALLGFASLSAALLSQAVAQLSCAKKRWQPFKKLSKNHSPRHPIGQGPDLCYLFTRVVNIVLVARCVSSLFLSLQWHRWL